MIGLAAVCRLSADPPRAVRLLGDRIKPMSEISAEQLALTKQLGDADFKTREDATTRLRTLGLDAEPALRAALAEKPGGERRQRLEALIAGLEVGKPLEGDRLRKVRAVWALERAGTPESRRLLEAWAAGVPHAPLTREAAATLGRVAR
jgi:hypothetical protein